MAVFIVIMILVCMPFILGLFMALAALAITAWRLIRIFYYCIIRPYTIHCYHYWTDKEYRANYNDKKEKTPKKVKTKKKNYEIGKVKEI